MRLLLSVFSPPVGAMGPHTRVLAVGRQAREMGHEVAFCATGSVVDELSANGYRVYEMPSLSTMGLPSVASKFARQRIGTAIPPMRRGRPFGNIWLVLVLAGVGNARLMRRLVAAEVAAIDDFRPDALFTELEPACYLAAEITQVPLASTYASIASHGSRSLSYRLVSRSARKVLQSYGRPVRELSDLCFGKQVLKIIPSSPELDGTEPSRSEVRYVGYLLDERIQIPPQSPLVDTDSRYVFTYLGTGSVPFRRAKHVIREVFPEGSQVQCVVASQFVRNAERLGAVDFRRYVPASQILPHACWTICHGGHNTIVQSLLHGVPLLVFPGALFERRFNAAMVEKCGLGFMGETSNFSVDWIRSRLERHSELVRCAREMGHRLRSFGGPANAVKAIEAHSQASSAICEE